MVNDFIEDPDERVCWVAVPFDDLRPPTIPTTTPSEFIQQLTPTCNRHPNIVRHSQCPEFVSYKSLPKIGFDMECCCFVSYPSSYFIFNTCDVYSCTRRIAASAFLPVILGLLPNHFRPSYIGFAMSLHPTIHQGWFLSCSIPLSLR